MLAEQYWKSNMYTGFYECGIRARKISRDMESTNAVISKIATAQFANPILRASRALHAYHVPPRALIGLLGWSSAVIGHRLQVIASDSGRTLYALRPLSRSSRSYRDSYSRLLWIWELYGCRKRAQFSIRPYRVVVSYSVSMKWQLAGTTIAFINAISLVSKFVALQLINPCRVRDSLRNTMNRVIKRRERDWREKKRQAKEGGRFDGIADPRVR